MVTDDLRMYLVTEWIGTEPLLSCFFVCLVGRVFESNRSKSEYPLYIRNRELRQKESNPTAPESLRSVDSSSKV
jgi:hypothetical protein